MSTPLLKPFSELLLTLPVSLLGWVPVLHAAVVKAAITYAERYLHENENSSHSMTRFHVSCLFSFQVPRLQDKPVSDAACA